MRITRTTVVLVAALAATTIAVASAAGAKPRPVRPVIGQPQATPAAAAAGDPFAVAFRVIRSDNHKALAGGKASWAVTAGGVAVPHTSSFKAGVARISLVVPEQAAALRVVLTVKLGAQQASRTTSFAVVPLPSLSVGDVSAPEGVQAAPGKLSFPVTLSKASTKTVTVAYTTADGTATTPADYAAASGTLTFAPGETQKTVDVALVGDLAVEPDETLSLKLSQPANALLPKDTATGTISNDDVAPKPGHYTGRSSQGNNVDFDLTNDLTVTDFTMAINLFCEQPVGQYIKADIKLGRQQLPIDPATGKFSFAVGDNGASLELSGTIEPPDKASGQAAGSLTIIAFHQHVQCSASGPWSASWASPLS